MHIQVGWDKLRSSRGKVERTSGDTGRDDILLLEVVVSFAASTEVDRIRFPVYACETGRTVENRFDNPADLVPAAGEPSLRILVVAAHPDDETIGAGILISRSPSAQVLHVTDGAASVTGYLPTRFLGRPAEYAEERRRELVAAMALVGVEESRLHRLNVPDLGAAFVLPSLARRTADLLDRLRPDAVATHAYEGGHPDHDATAFAVHAAAELLRREGLPAPAILEMALYHAQLDSSSPRPVCGFLPEPPDFKSRPVVIEPTPQERELKQRMLDCFGTQRAVLRWLPLAPRESLRLAPRYDFTRPPHAGLLLYELAGLPISGESWRALALAARRDLGIHPGGPAGPH